MTKQSKNENILVTGGAGFIGSHICEKLLDHDYSIICIDNFNDFYNPSIKRKNIECIERKSKQKNGYFKLYEGDIRDSKTLESLFDLEPIDVIIHLAAMPGVRISLDKPDLYHDVNVGGTKTLMNAVTKKNIKKVIFASSSSVYGNSKEIPFKETQKKYCTISPYAETKRKNEIYLEKLADQNSINVAILRFFSVYGPRQRPDMAINKFVRHSVEGKAIPLYGDGELKRDYTYIDDIVSGIMGATKWINDLEHYGRSETFNLSSGKFITLNEIIKSIEKSLGKKLCLENKKVPSSEMVLTLGDITKAKEVLGYTPKFSLDEGMDIFINWYRNNK